MNNPYSPPLADAAAPEPRQPAKLGFWLVSVSLSLAWWLALLVPEVTRKLLLSGEIVEMFDPPTQVVGSNDQVVPIAVVWGLVRIIGIVTAACAIFRAVARARPKPRWPCAALCLWLGSGVFALTLHVTSIEDVIFLFFLAPLFFLYTAWFVVLPMLAISVLALSRTT